MNNQNNNQIELATDITVAWLSNQNTRAAVDDIPAFLKSMHEALGLLGSSTTGEEGQDVAAAEHKPAIGSRASLKIVGKIISMIDGKPYSSLTRHLKAHGLTPDEYRARYGLKADYPMVAEAYSAARSEVAKRLGLGRRPGQKVEKKAGKETATADKPASKGRKGKSVADAKAAAKAHLGGDGE